MEDMLSAVTNKLKSYFSPEDRGKPIKRRREGASYAGGELDDSDIEVDCILAPKPKKSRPSAWLNILPFHIVDWLYPAPTEFKRQYDIRQNQSQTTKPELVERRVPMTESRNYNHSHQFLSSAPIANNSGDGKKASYRLNSSVVDDGSKFKHPAKYVEIDGNCISNGRHQRPVVQPRRSNNSPGRETGHSVIPEKGVKSRLKSYQPSLSHLVTSRRPLNSGPHQDRFRTQRPDTTARQLEDLEDLERYRQVVQNFTNVSMTSCSASSGWRSSMKSKARQSIFDRCSLDSTASQLSTPRLFKEQLSPGEQQELKQRIIAASNRRAMAVDTSDLLQPVNGAASTKSSKSVMTDPVEISPPSTPSLGSTVESEMKSTDSLQVIASTLPAPPTFSKVLRQSPYSDMSWVDNLKQRFERSARARKRDIEESELMTKLLKEQREAAQLSLEERIRQRMKITEAEPPVIEEAEYVESEEEEEISRLPELMPEMESKIDLALRPHPPGEVLVDAFRLSITRKDMHTLAGLNWLNDEVINFYTTLLVERGKSESYPSVYAFNTFFQPKLKSSGYDSVKRWTRKVNIFSYDILIVPVHLGIHWCLAVIDFRTKAINYYDSMQGPNEQCLDLLQTYLVRESQEKLKKPFDLSDWTSSNVTGIPAQMNACDCGMFAIRYAEYICRDAPLTFTQDDMPYFRRRTVYEILTAKLL